MIFLWKNLVKINLKFKNTILCLSCLQRVGQKCKFRHLRHKLRDHNRKFRDFHYRDRLRSCLLQPCLIHQGRVLNVFILYNSKYNSYFSLKIVSPAGGSGFSQVEPSAPTIIIIKYLLDMFLFQSSPCFLTFTRSDLRLEVFFAFFWFFDAVSILTGAAGDLGTELWHFF